MCPECQNALDDELTCSSHGRYHWHSSTLTEERCISHLIGAAGSSRLLFLAPACHGMYPHEMAVHVDRWRCTTSGCAVEAPLSEEDARVVAAMREHGWTSTRLVPEAA
ncbi:MAG: hypothetical protein Q8Q14_10785 [Gemmatimonadales bacterium]|nr:hypothetical protein [Gemmatimonadales bacterium]